MAKELTKEEKEQAERFFNKDDSTFEIIKEKDIEKEQ